MTTETFDDSCIELRDALGNTIGWLPTDVARGLGIDVSESGRAITVEERRLMQAHPAFLPASQ